MHKTQRSKWGAALAAALILAGMFGCGGGNNDVVNDFPAPRITRSTESSFSESARILAAREAATSGTTWLNANVASSFDSDLAVIRRNFSQVNDIAARPDYDLRSVVVAVRAGTPWLTNWSRGDATTGEPALDALLGEFGPESIQSAGSIGNGSPTYYSIRFGQSLNMVKLAERLEAASQNITAAEPNYTAGDGNNITVANGSDSNPRRYTFSRGSGDCPAGCINRYSYEFAIVPGEATATLVREGDGLSR